MELNLCSHGHVELRMSYAERRKMEEAAKSLMKATYRHQLVEEVGVDSYRTMLSFLKHSRKFAAAHERSIQHEERKGATPA
jgi:hypothetical protein